MVHRLTTYINKLEFDENEEIKMYSTIEYIGEEDIIILVRRTIF